eukprot:CAMPEP_0113628368 /NCGR_PEP_ID=MMETSP0017_2-20120614/14698_1 /TAXON_ID=2856 /ORGANISM="Cylindrotheca closterium" /LENGTH=466 /DNA_ID=CAMNT_0000538669 /DNA_START=276 /DNA_END=1676 /DNA_ORIENTATION=- /assembly_acc=CAM_ASM_000147
MSLLESTGDASSTAHTDYEKWVRRLYLTNLFHPVKMGLTNIQRLHKLVGNPMDDPSRVVVHIAGTNGKGSVALKIANTLRQSGKRVGIFCSPHVSSFRERMQVNGELISEDEVVDLLPQVYELCVKHDIPATFFEITTLLAFLFYEKHQVDFVVLETGLGGRLDATNSIAHPALAVITSIGLEHTRILGDTVEKIAKEKGGIIKKGCPVLVGPNCPQGVLEDCAKRVGAGSYYVPDLVLGDSLDHQTTDYDEENQRIASAAILLLQQSHPNLLEDLTSDDIQKGVLIRPPCRFEEVQVGQVKAILDVAHNPPAMEYLMVKLQNTYPSQSFRFVVGMSSDKDLGQCARSLLSAVGPSSIHLVEAAHPRAAKIPDIVAAEPKFSDCHFSLDDRSITKQVINSLQLAEENGEILVVCGSVFLMAEARQALGFDEPRDSDYISEVAGAGLRQMQENFGNTTIEDGPSRQQ